MKNLFAIAAIALLAGCSNTAVPTVPVGPRIAVVNGGFEQAAQAGSVPGWTITQHAGIHAYDASVVSAGAFKGHGSFRIVRTHEQVYGSLIQNIAVDKFAGKTIELSAMMKSENVGPRGWKLFVNAPAKQAYSPGLTGTTGWQREAVKLALPPGARRIVIGASLLDGGTGWLDEVELHVLD